jgi:hypothetical protein
MSFFGSIVRLFCHVERSRDISGFGWENNQRFRDSASLRSE